MNLLIVIVLSFIVFMILFNSLIFVKEDEIALIKRNGRHNRVVASRYGFKIPFIETVYERISILPRKINFEVKSLGTLDAHRINLDISIIYSIVNAQKITGGTRFADEWIELTVRNSIIDLVRIRNLDEVLEVKREISNELKNILDKGLISSGYIIDTIEINKSYNG